jgi:sulfate transport system ATP-binding protein
VEPAQAQFPRRIIGRAWASRCSGSRTGRVARCLLLDEPFSAIDAKVRNILRNWLRRIQHEIDVTMVLVTNDEDEALEVGNRVAMFNRG